MRLVQVQVLKDHEWNYILRHPGESYEADSEDARFHTLITMGLAAMKDGGAATTTTTNPFHKGDRVTPNMTFARFSKTPLKAKKWSGRVGVVVSKPLKAAVLVIWDDVHSYSQYPWEQLLLVP